MAHSVCNIAAKMFTFLIFIENLCFYRVLLVCFGFVGFSVLFFVFSFKKKAVMDPF